MTPLDPTLLLAIALALSVGTVCGIVLTVQAVALARAWVAWLERRRS